MGINVCGIKWINYLFIFICINLIVILLFIIVYGINLLYIDRYNRFSNFNRSWKFILGRRNGDLKRKYEFKKNI